MDHGRLLGNYRVAGRLGGGAFGPIYMGYHVELDRRVAIKELAPEVRQDARFMERFRLEARLVQRFEQPNCVRVYEFLELEGGAYVISEYIDGVTLGEVVEKGGQLTGEQSLGVLKGALNGLAYAHRMEVVHRDVKPDNLMADTSGVPKLTDFGLAVFWAGQVPGGAGANATGLPDYMSPEQVTGKPVDLRSDMYSSGAVLFELLTGRPPYVADNALALMEMHVDAPVPDPREIHADVPKPVAAMVMKAMDKDAAHRHQTATEFLTELQIAALRAYGSEWQARSSIAPRVIAAMGGR
jgi:serine/threonine protein kinase